MQRGTSAAAPATLRSSILGLHRTAGNRAVASLLQRKTEWKDASKQGKAWNAGERQVGKIRRIPLEGLAEGLDSNVKRAGGRKIPALSSESATGKAIVLMPAALDATGSIEVLVFLHGFTEGTHRPYAGWRQLVEDAPATTSDRMKRLRQGLDKDDKAPVRDVALDNAAQQLEESGQTQLVIILPQGGLTSEFSKDGTRDFDAGRMVTEVVDRLQTEKCWLDAAGKPVSAPSVRRVAMAGHSGAGAALSNMTNEAVKAKRAKPGKPPPAGKSSPLTGDLVIYDAINGSTQLDRFIEWTTMQLDDALGKLTDQGVTDEAKHFFLWRAQKLRGFTTDSYIDAYIALDNAINRWFATNGAKLGAWSDCLRANFQLDYVDVSHEELMRGSLAGTPRAAGTGTILQAIRDLNPPRYMSTSACPAPPKPLKDRYAEYQKAKAAAAKAKKGR